MNFKKENIEFEFTGFENLQIKKEKLDFKSFQDFKQFILELGKENFLQINNIKDLDFHYYDEDNDKITISTDDDIFSFNQLKNNNQKLIIKGFSQFEKTIDLMDFQEKKQEKQNNDQQLKGDEKQQQQQSQLSNDEVTEIKKVRKMSLFSQEEKEKVPEIIPPMVELFRQDQLIISKDQLDKLVQEKVELSLKEKIPQIIENIMNQVQQKFDQQSKQLLEQQQKNEQQQGVQKQGEEKQKKIEQRSKLVLFNKIESILLQSQEEFLNCLINEKEETIGIRFDEIQNQMNQNLFQLRQHLNSDLEASVLRNKLNSKNKKGASEPAQQNYVQTYILSQPIAQQKQIPQPNLDNQAFPKIPNQDNIKPQPLNKQEFKNNCIKKIQEVCGGDYDYISQFVGINTQIKDLDLMVNAYINSQQK